MDQAAKKLGDTNAQSMYSILSERLKWGGIISEDVNPIRVFSNHSIVHQNFTNAYSIAKQNKNKTMRGGVYPCFGNRPPVLEVVLCQIVPCNLNYLI